MARRAPPLVPIRPRLVSPRALAVTDLLVATKRLGAAQAQAGCGASEGDYLQLTHSLASREGWSSHPCECFKGCAAINVKVGIRLLLLHM
jgi:hypothetical protein